MSPEAWLWATVAVCAAIAIVDPATMMKRRRRNRLPSRTLSPGQQVVGVDGSTREARERSCPGPVPARASRADREEVDAPRGQRGSEEGGPPAPSAAANKAAPAPRPLPLADTTPLLVRARLERDAFRLANIAALRLSTSVHESDREAACVVYDLALVHLQVSRALARSLEAA